jgi:MFS family permease
VTAAITGGGQAAHGSPAGSRRALAGTASFMLAILLVVSFVTDTQGLVLLPLLGKMTLALRLSGSQVSWSINATSIAAAVALGLSARYADVVGHRKVLLPLLAMGAIGSALAALATSYDVLLVGRILQGTAVAAPMSWAMLKVRTDAAGLERASLLNGAVICVMTPLGLILGGILLELGASWNSVFWIITAGYLVLFAMVLAAPETPAALRTKTRIDWIGSLGLGAWLVCILIAISNGQAWGWWNSASFVGFLVAGIVLLIAWAVEQRLISYPLLDLRGMDKRQVISGYTAFMTVSAMASGLFILLPGLAETPGIFGYGLGDSVLKSSLTLMPILPAAFISSYLAKLLLPRVGPRPVLVIGGVTCIIAFLWLAFVHAQLWQLYVGVAIYGIGVVMAFNVGLALTAAAGRQDNMSITFGIQYALSIPAGALMVAVLLVVQHSDLIPRTPVPTEHTYTVNFIIIAGVAAVGYVLNGLVIAPRRLRHQLDIPTEAATSALVGEIGAGGIPLE